MTDATLAARQPKVEKKYRTRSGEKNVEQRKLKIKFKSLSSEQRDIKLETLREKWRQRAIRGRIKAGLAKPEEGLGITDVTSLRLHRLKLRQMLRCTHIARGFLRGTPYDDIEPFSWTQPDWNHVQRLVAKYSGLDQGVVLQRFAEWVDGALRGCKPFLTAEGQDDTRTPGSSRHRDRWVMTRAGAKQKFPNLEVGT